MEKFSSTILEEGSWQTTEFTNAAMISVQRIISTLKGYPHTQRVNFTSSMEDLWINNFPVDANNFIQALWRLIENALDEQEKGMIDVGFSVRTRDVVIKITNDGSINYGLLRQKALKAIRNRQLRQTDDGTIKVVVNPHGIENSWSLIKEEDLDKFIKVDEDLLWVEGLSTKTRAQRASGRVMGGAGGWLNYEKKVIENMKGEIQVESNAGKTSFTLRVPRGHRDIMRPDSDPAMNVSLRNVFRDLMKYPNENGRIDFPGGIPDLSLDIHPLSILSFTRDLLWNIIENALDEQGRRNIIDKETDRKVRIQFRVRGDYVSVNIINNGQFDFGSIA